MASPKRLLDILVRGPISDRPSTPCSTFTVVQIQHNVYNGSVVAYDSELTGTTINSGVDGGSSFSLLLSPRDI